MNPECIAAAVCLKFNLPGFSCIQEAEPGLCACWAHVLPLSYALILPFRRNVRVSICFPSQQITFSQRDFFLGVLCLTILMFSPPAARSVPFEGKETAGSLCPLDPGEI